MNPKRHHFLPEFYLHGFTRAGYLSIYDRVKNEFRRQSPRNTAVIGHYYTTTNQSGEREYGIEEFLSRIESKAKPVITKLEAGGTITPEERLNLAYFIATLLSRTPKFEREAESITDSFHKIVAKEMIPTVEAAAEVLRRSGKSEGLAPEGFFKFIHDERYTLKAPRNNTIRLMLDLSTKIAKELAFMDWGIVHAHESSAFVTTDSPLGFVVPEALKRTAQPVLGLGSQLVTKLIPLTQQIALLMGHQGAGFGHFSVSRHQVRDINLAVASECERHVIGADEAHVRCIVRRSKVDKAKTGTRMKVESVPHPTDPLRGYIISRRVAADASDKPLKIIVEPN
jgi:hypothetical protein